LLESLTKNLLEKLFRACVSEPVYLKKCDGLLEPNISLSIAVAREASTLMKNTQ